MRDACGMHARYMRDWELAGRRRGDGGLASERNAKLKNECFRIHGLLFELTSEES